MSKAMIATISAYSTAVTPSSRSCPPRRARRRPRVTDRYDSTGPAPLGFPTGQCSGHAWKPCRRGALGASPAGMTNQSAASLSLSTNVGDTRSWGVEVALHVREQEVEAGNHEQGDDRDHERVLDRGDTVFTRPHLREPGAEVVDRRAQQEHSSAPPFPPQGPPAARWPNDMSRWFSVGPASGEARPVAACLADTLQGNLVAQGGTCPSGLVQIGPAQNYPPGRVHSAARAVQQST